MANTFPGKIMLFGEHSIACQSQALVVPFFAKTARWAFYPENEQTPTIKASAESLAALVEYLKNTPDLASSFNLEAFEAELKKALYFDSDIPQGYGAGSSGALVAAVYERFYVGPKPGDNKQLKALLSRIESFFHGSSSGIDPLCCLLQKTIKIDENGSLLSLADFTQEIDRFPVNVFLIDTQTTSSTAQMVAHFKEKLLHYSFFKRLNEQYIPANNQAIESFVTGDFSRFLVEAERISVLQQRELGRMIPDDFQQHFGPIGAEKPFTLKLCGSGGGGYLLGFTTEKEKSIRYLEEAGLQFEFPEFGR
ncbi:MAG: hypothetical protein M0Q90_06820 [Bacteroidales bacterium]|nr:hypothetical protein [Bacteroidales bacterium]